MRGERVPAWLGQPVQMGLRQPRACLRRNNDAGRVVGVISDADLMRREELGSEKTRPWWLKALTPCATLAKEFTKSHGKRVEELMSSQVISANEDASLGEIAALLEKHRIERVPILTGGKLVGILRVP